MKKYVARLTDDYLKTAKEDEKGISRFSILSDPAIGVKGYFFKKQLNFQNIDGLKMRIAAPAMLPMEIYRQKEGNDVEHEIIFDEQGLTELYEQFMKTFVQGELINVDHSEEIAPAYIREIWQIENPETDRANTEFGFNLPKGTIFVILQFTDKNYFESIVKSGRTGISVEAFFERYEYKFKNQNKMKKKKYKFIANVVDENGKTEDGTQVIVMSDDEEITEGSEVVVLDGDLEEIENYSGDLIVDDETIVVEAGKVTEIDNGEPTAEELEAEQKAKEEAEAKAKEEKMKKQKFRKQKSKRILKFQKNKKRYHFEVESSEGEAEGEPVEVLSNEEVLKENTEIVVIFEDLTNDTDYTGELVVEGETIHVEDGVIVEIEGTEEEVELEDETQKDNGCDSLKEALNEVLKRIGELEAKISQPANPTQQNFSNQGKKANMFKSKK